MGFPNTVNLYSAGAVAGDVASENPVVYAPGNHPAASGGCRVGRFVWLGGSGLTNAGVGQPLGLVRRELRFPNYVVTDDGSLLVPAGSAPSVMRFADAFVVTTSSATAGQKIFASLTTGEISAAAAGAAVSGSVETPWTVVSGGDAGALIMITAWNPVMPADLTSYMTTDFANATGALDVEHGGTGLNAVGTAGQALVTNAGADAIEWGTPS